MNRRAILTLLGLAPFHPRQLFASEESVEPRILVQVYGME